MAVLRAHFFYTPEAAPLFQQVSKLQIEKGSAFLRRFGAKITLESYPKGGGGTKIPGTGSLINPNLTDGGLAEYLTLRNQCHAAEPNADPPRVPVIFLQFTSVIDAGQTVQKSTNQTWLPFIMIDVKRAHPDGLTLLHEMGHCVGMMHPGYQTRVPGYSSLGPNDASNFMGYGFPKMDTNGAVPNEFEDRNLCDDWQLWLLRTAYFYAN